MARRGGVKRQSGPTQMSIEASRTRVREVVTAIAAEVIAETATRLKAGQRPQAAALRISTGRRTGPAKPR